MFRSPPFDPGQTPCSLSIIISRDRSHGAPCRGGRRDEVLDQNAGGHRADHGFDLNFP